MKNSGNNQSRNFLEWVKQANQISEMILKNKDLDSTIHLILDMLNKSLESIFLIYFRFDDKKNELVFHAFSQSVSHFILNILKSFKFNAYNIKYPLSVEGPLITECVKKNTIIQSTKLKEFFFPVFKWETILEKIQAGLKIYNCIAIPMRLAGKHTGVFFIATRKKALSLEEHEMLKFYSNQFKIAYDHDQKIKLLEDQYLLEKETSAMLAHEFKTPIAIGYNTTQIMDYALERYEKDMGYNVSDLQKIQGKLRDGMQHMSQLCDSILTLREVEGKISPAAQELNIDKFFMDIVRNFKQKAKEKKLYFHYHSKIDPGKLYGAGIQFEQVVTILLDNAIKYTNDGGVNVELELNKQYLKCVITDTGIGIPKKEMGRIFDRFYRIKNRKTKETYVKGLGLGLYIAKKIIDALDGSLQVTQNLKGKGTIFTAKVPVYTKKTKQKNGKIDSGRFFSSA